ncbi:MAG: flagellar basal body P-ring protein FlgI [Pirellulaceae bacterium]
MSSLGRRTRLCLLRPRSSSGRQGSRIRCRVDSLSAATSLVGGNLMEASLTWRSARGGRGEMPHSRHRIRPRGPRELRHATAGKIDDGCQVVVDFEHRFTYVARLSNEGQQFQIDPLTGRPLRGSDELELDAPEMMFFDLVIKPEHATFGTATEIAETVREYSFVPNGDAEVNAAIPRAKDQVTVQVPIPSQYAEDPVQYISEVLDLELHNKPKSTTVVINRQSGVLIIGDDVRFDPAAVSSGGMMVETESVRRLDLEDNGLVPPGPGVQLKKLTAALNQLQVPSETLMDIIVQLKEGGFLYGELIIQE